MAEVPGPVVRRRWPIPRAALRPLHTQLDRGHLSTRALDRVLKIAWTLADLAERAEPGAAEVLEATALRLRFDLTSLRASA